MSNPFRPKSIVAPCVSEISVPRDDSVDLSVLQMFRFRSLPIRNIKKFYDEFFDKIDNNKPLCLIRSNRVIR